MPEGIYDRLSAKPRTIKGIIKQYAEFCLRDIGNKLELIAEPWQFNDLKKRQKSKLDHKQPKIKLEN